MSIEKGTPIRGHWNLTKHEVVIQTKTDKGWRVDFSAACHSLTMEGVTFHVSEPSRQRNVRNNSRDVHARLKGAFVEASQGTTPNPGEGWVEVHYNPFRGPLFHRADGTPVHAADKIIITHSSNNPKSGIVYAYGIREE